VDASGELPDGRAFQDIHDLKQLLLANERQIARNLAQQLTIYATGAPIRFGDRPQIERILDQAAADEYGVRCQCSRRPPSAARIAAAMRRTAHGVCRLHLG
jgi:hypothetical protein